MRKSVNEWQINISKLIFCYQIELYCTKAQVKIINICSFQELLALYNMTANASFKTLENNKYINIILPFHKEYFGNLATHKGSVLLMIYQHYFISINHFYVFAMKA